MNESDLEICCELNSQELQERKSTLLVMLKSAILEKQEIRDGFVYAFPGDDNMLSKLFSFIKSERLCCPFFKFELTIQELKNPVWLKITGPDGVKEFIEHELNL